NRPKHTRKRIHQAKKNFLEKFKTASNSLYTLNGIKMCIFCLCDSKISHAYKSIINLTPDYL
ncbi:hypothetical protein, partial [Phocaeicola intestinalis]|uniref:hypothetical protein n=1 Tax=Phocaeicola intestinalis TaxID=2762212 RepID=UPI001CD8CFE4